jgi:hypothetical protein
MFEQIEKMKRQYTDKYVVVDATRPELARFRDVVGRVKTVNMSGRALVEFDDYHLNIGWYDIDPEFLKVVDKPPPKAPKAEAKKPAAAEAKPAAAKPAPAAGATAAGKGSVADILAAARGGKAPAKPAGETAKAEKGAAAPAKPQAAAKVDRSKMSVADMMAAARGEKAGAAKAAPAKPQAEEAPAEKEPAAEAPVTKAATPAPSSGEVRRVDRSKMSVADMLAYCREHDAK